MKRYAAWGDMYVDEDEGNYVRYDEVLELIAERDNLLEQYRADRLESDAIIYWTRHWIGQIGGGVYSLDEGLRYVNEQLSHYPGLSALESALKAKLLAGKIEGMEEAVSICEAFGNTLEDDNGSNYAEEIQHRIAELKEGKCL